MSGTGASVEDKNRALVRRFLEIMRTRDFGALSEVLHPEFVQESPQSRERIRGVDNLRAMLENYPGGVGSGIDTDSKITVPGRFGLVRCLHHHCARGEDRETGRVLRAMLPGSRMACSLG